MSKNLVLLLLLVTLALFLLTIYVANVGAQQPNAPLPLAKDSAVRVASVTPSANPIAFPSDVYPPPVPVAPGINISIMTTGCPNVEGLEQASELPASAMNQVY